MRRGPSPAPPRSPRLQAIALGRRLFNERFLSESGARACASCHYPIQSFTDGLTKARAFGRELKRNTPGLWNLAWSKALFWDARAANLEDQARVPLTAPDEMGHALEEAAQRIAARPFYAEEFAAAFPDAPGITVENLLRALASYERGLVSPLTRFDLWVGGDAGALSALEQRGFALFTGAAGCAGCHSGFAFTDGAVHAPGATDADLGRGGVTGLAEDMHAFRTPSLRELAYTAPYMHDGSAATLADAVRAHGGEAAGVRLDGEDRAALLAFLATLSSPGPPVAAPPLDDAGNIVTRAE
jgi:cytochrome c peroxidase